VTDFRIVTGCVGVVALVLLLVRELYPGRFSDRAANVLDAAMILLFAVLVILVVDGIYGF